MIVRERPDGTAFVISQEAHADVAAQFAAHWGNDQFSRFDAYPSMVFATIYHDSGHREMEADLPIDVEKGFPYAFRGAPPAVRRREADTANIKWVHARDPYAGLIVSMHHAGLRKRRYDTVRARLVGRNGGGASPADGPPLGIEAAFEDLEEWQRGVADQLGLSAPGARSAFWHNYRTFQVFDLLSLHFCCDGYAGDQVQEVVLERVPVGYGSEEVVDIRLVPTGPDSVRMSPYPFDVGPLEVSVLARQMAPCVDAPDLAAQEAYHKARRQALVWEISD